jgi:alpha-glucosidase (family GH31 glycosyl hydrolase)
MLDCVNLRYQLMPYIYTAARQAYDTGVSICRPLYYEWPEENEAYRQEGEYMFGNDILVSPIVTPVDADGKAFHKTWLPSGQWYDVCRQKLVHGSQIIADNYSQSEIPYFIKAGSIIVCNPLMDNLKEPVKQLIIKVAPGADGETLLYEDAGDTQDYINGGYTTTLIRQTRTDKSIELTLEPRQGQFEGMLTERAYEIELIQEGAPQTVTINGAPMSDWHLDEATSNLIITVPVTVCNQKLTINVERASLGIHDINGKSLVKMSYYDLRGNMMSRKPSGPYIQRCIWNDGTTTTQKFVK